MSGTTAGRRLASTTTSRPAARWACSQGRYLRAVLGRQRQAAGHGDAQAGLGFAGGDQSRRRHLPVGHALAVEAVAGLALRVQTHHRERRGLVHRLRLGECHAGLRNALGQQAAEAVARERVEVERAHALQAERAGEVVDGAARAGAQPPVGVLDQIDERFASGGDL